MPEASSTADTCLRPVAQFEIFCRQYMDAHGQPVCPLPAFAEDGEVMRGLYRLMVLTRTFDERAISLQRTGRLGTFPSSLGQEAVGVGVAAAMKENDVLLPSFREHGAKLQRGVTLKELFLFWGGDERGNNYSGPQNDFPDCIPVASHFPHAAGAALALKMLSPGAVAVVIAGDGSTSKGDFYEALNIAGTWDLPVLFVISNNAWAISVPRQAQSGAETLAQKAIAAGVHSEQVDGNDIVAVHSAAQEALDAIRSGSGPRFIEALTYRLCDHTTVDDARRYRSDTDVSRHWQQEPLVRLRTFLTDRHGWTKDDETGLLERCRDEVDNGAKDYLAAKAEPATAIVDFLFAALPDTIKGQRLALTEKEPSDHA